MTPRRVIRANVWSLSLVENLNYDIPINGSFLQNPTQCYSLSSWSNAVFSLTIFVSASIMLKDIGYIRNDFRKAIPHGMQVVSCIWHYLDYASLTILDTYFSRWHSWIILILFFPHALYDDNSCLLLQNMKLWAAVLREISYQLSIIMVQYHLVGANIGTHLIIKSAKGSLRDYDWQMPRNTKCRLPCNHSFLFTFHCIVHPYRHYW